MKKISINEILANPLVIQSSDIDAIETNFPKDTHFWINKRGDKINYGLEIWLGKSVTVESDVPEKFFLEYPGNLTEYIREKCEKKFNQFKLPVKEITIKAKKLAEHAKIPTRSNDTAAGWDLYALESQRITTGNVGRVQTGIAVEIPPEYYGQIFMRSGVGLNRKAVPTGGVIDPDYRGDVSVLVANVGNNPMDIEAGERIAQLIILPRPNTTLVEVDELSDTERGERGFGSSGK